MNKFQRGVSIPERVAAFAGIRNQDETEFAYDSDVF